MSKLTVLTVISVGVAVISHLLIKRKTKKLPSINDDLFLERFKDTFPDIPDGIVLEERRNIAKNLGIYYEKLDVTTSFNELSKHLNFLGSYDLSIGDLEQDMSELFERKQVEQPYLTPSTIGELIAEIVKVKVHRRKTDKIQ